MTDHHLRWQNIKTKRSNTNPLVLLLKTRAVGAKLEPSMPGCLSFPHLCHNHWDIIALLPLINYSLPVSYVNKAHLVPSPYPAKWPWSWCNPAWSSSDISKSHVGAVAIHYLALFRCLPQFHCSCATVNTVYINIWTFTAGLPSHFCFSSWLSGQKPWKCISYNSFSKHGKWFTS